MCEAGDHHGGGDKSAGDQGVGQLGVFFSEIGHDLGIAQKGFLGEKDTSTGALPPANIGSDGSISFGPSETDSKMAFILNDMRANGKSDEAKKAADKVFQNVW